MEETELVGMMLTFTNEVLGQLEIPGPESQSLVMYKQNKTAQNKAV